MRHAAFVTLIARLPHSRYSPLSSLSSLSPLSSISSMSSISPISSPSQLSTRHAASRPFPHVTAHPRMQTTGPSSADDSIMAGVHQKLSTALAPTRLQVVPTYGDPNGSHVSIEVVSEAFRGLSPVKRHQEVYRVIWEELSGPIHAVDELVTKTPEEDTS